MLPAWPHALNAAQYQDLAVTYNNVAEVQRRRRQPNDPVEEAWLDGISVDLSRYLVVRSAGFLEEIRDEAAADFTHRASSAKVLAYVRTTIGKGGGVSPGQLETFMNNFDVAMGKSIKDALSANNNILSSRLGTLVKSRKQIAHGQGNNVNESRALVGCETAVTVADLVVQEFLRA
jgi:hypothetical protein